MKLRSPTLITTLFAISISHSVHAATGTWNVDANGLWSTSGNWSGGTIANDNTSTANFTNNITADRIVSLDSARTLNKLVFSDAATGSAGSWLINNNDNAANILTLGGTTPTITVNALGTGKSAEISAVLAGNTERITKAGTGTLVLSGANTYSVGMVVTGGVVIMNNASANIGGTKAASDTTGSSININGTSALRQSAGKITISGANDSTHTGLFSDTPGYNGLVTGGASTYGAYELSGGTLEINDPWRLNPRRSQITQTGGAFNVNYTGTGAVAGGREFIIGSGDERGVIYATAGTTSITTASTLTGRVLIISDTTNNGYGNANGADLTISGTADWSVTGGAGYIHMTRTGDADAETGNLNLNGSGRLTTNGIAIGDTAGIGRLNFNGGTLRAAINNTTFLQGLTSARIYSGGATIDTNDKNITIGQNLDAPTGNGLTSVAIATGGSGYVGAPIVTITGGGGTGATAVANFDAATGTVTGITITNPGSGYTSNPTVTLNHGFQTGGSTATLGAVNIGALTGGGLTKSNTGTLTLSGNNSYTGATTITGGTLKLAATSSTNNISGSTKIIVGDTLANNSATLDVTGLTSGTLALTSSQTLGGHGTITGGVTAASGSHISPGNNVGILSVTNGLTYNNGSIFEWEINRSMTQTRGIGYDAVNVAGTLSGSGAKFQIVIGDSGFTNTFWDTNRNWTNIFTAANGSTAKEAWASIFSGGFEYFYNNGSTLTSISPTGQGVFSFTDNNTLTWTAVPEPTSALAGLLITAGLLRRRRTA